jgi:hypothetical protein
MRTLPAIQNPFYLTNNEKRKKFADGTRWNQEKTMILSEETSTLFSLFLLK